MNDEEILNAFKCFDTNGDGLINLEEYIQGCRNNGNTATEESLKEMFELFDVDHDGHIDAKEFYFASNFLGISKSFVKVGMDQVAAAFQKYDTNGDGLISLEEYIEGCHASGNKASDEALTKAFRLFDVNDDKFMDKKEFYCAMNFLAATE